MSIFHLLDHNGLKALIDKITAYFYTQSQTDTLLDDKVDKESGKGLSTEDYTTAEKTKLSNIEAGAEVNVQSDWSQSDNTKDDYIKNKPTLRQPSADGTAGQYLKSNGSGNAPSWETMDSTPTANSTKAVTSGGVKTALDGKQASITITTNANTPTDNDTVIMQDNGNTGTTSFLRRKLSTLWNYFRTKKFPEVNIEWGTSDVIRDVSALDFVSNYRQRGNALPSSAIVYERSTDGGATWVDDSSHVGFVNQADRLRITIIGSESDGSMNVIYCQVAKHFINMKAGTCHYALYGINKEGEVYQITSGRVSGNTHPNSIYAKNTLLGYYKTQYQADAYIKHRFEFWQEEGDVTYTGGKYPLYVGLTPKVIWGGNNTLLFGVPYVITTDNTTYKENVKFPQNVEATKFVKTRGTNSQVLLANGDVMSLPVPINNGGTGATTAIGAEYNILNQVANMDNTALADDRRFAICNQTKSATNGVFRWYKLSALWTWIKTHFDSSPTSGSGNGITSGAVYTALNNKQNKFITFDVPDNAGFATLTLISDITESLSTPNWTGHGIIGFMYGWRAGNLSGSTAQRITCWGNHDTGNIKLQTDNNHSNALKPLLVYYNSRYYLALKKNKRSGMTHYFIGYVQNLLSAYINLYANSDESKWYSDSSRTTEVTFTITKDYSRYEGGYINFMGDSSQVVLGTGELKTIDTAVASGSSNLVTSGAVATAIAGMDLSGKVNLQPDFTASQIDYSASNVGKWQKVLRFPDGADLVINMKKTAMGSDATSTLWFSSSSMGESYASLFGNHSVRFVRDGGYVFLCLACRKSTNEPIESYTFQIAHSSVPMSDIVAVTDASPITATPKEPNIVYRAPMTTGAVSFTVNNGAGSVAMANHNDFVGNMTSEASNGVVVTMSGATEGQIYRFVFTRNITGGVTFKQSNVAYCTIQGDVNAGDTITLTAVSNTADGWLYEQESAGIKSTDGSVNVEYDGGVADLSVETPTIWNNSEFFREKKVFEIGDDAISVRRTSDIDRPYVTMYSTTLLKFYVNNDTSVSYTYYPVTAGNTYHVKAVNYSTPDSELDITATQDGYLFYLDLGAANMIANNSVECYYMSGSSFAMSPLSMSFYTDTSTHSYAIITMQQVLAENLITLLINVKRSNLNPSIAFGHSTSAKGEDSIAVGQYAKADARQSLALGFLARALNDGSIAIGHNSAAFGLNGIAIGDGSRGYNSSNIAIGLNATTDKQYSVAIGSYAEGKKETSIAIGFTAKTNEINTIAIGALSFAGGYSSVAIGSRACAERVTSVAIGKDTRAGMSSDSNDRPYLNVKEFMAVQFTDGGESVMAKICETTEDVTISVSGNDYTLTPPAENRTLVVVNDAYAQYLYRLLSGYIKINGVTGYYAGNSTGADLPFEQLTGSYYAVWLRLAGSYTTPITSLSFIASYTDTNVGDYQVAVGSNLQSFRDSCVAVGHFLMSTRAYQTVIGSGNIPDYDALFIVGAGGNVTNARKNILTVDYREQLQVKGVRTQVARMTTSGTITGVNNIYLIGSGCTVALPSTGEEGQVLKVCAEGNCTVGGVSLEAGKFREYVCAGGAWYTRE